MCKAIVAAVVMSLLALAAAAEDKSRTSPTVALAVFNAQQRSPSGTASYLGVYIRDVRPERVSELKLKEQRGAEITMVDRDGPAGKAGLKEHDVILSFASKPVQDADDLRRMIQQTPAGAKVAFEVSRDGKPITVNVELGSRSEALSRRAAPTVDIPSMEIPGISIVQHSRRYGAVVEALTPQLAEYFGAKNGQGILVRSVEKGSPADSAGFVAGDVILRVGDEIMDDVGDWGRALHHNDGEKVAVTVLRNHKERTITFAVPARKKNGGGQASIELAFPAIEDLQAYFSSFGEEIKERVDETLRSEEMQKLLERHRDNADKLQRDLARIGPEFDRAMRHLREQLNQALKEHEKKLRRMD